VIFWRGCLYPKIKLKEKLIMKKAYLSEKYEGCNNEAISAIPDCRTCTEDFCPGQCCSAIDGACGAERFEIMTTNIKKGNAPSSIYSSIQEGQYQGLIDPCLHCNRYLDNDLAEEPSCVGWAAMGGVSLVEKEELAIAG
jgi:hypothetical protein